MKVAITFYFLILYFHISAQWESMEGPFGGSINSMAYSTPYLFVVSSDALYRSADDGSSWEKVMIEDDVIVRSTIGANNNVLVAVTSKINDGLDSKSMFRSEDFGFSWFEIQRPTDDALLKFAIIDSILYVADFDSLWFSIDAGNSFTPSSLQPSTGYIVGLDVFENDIYVNFGEKTFKSTTLFDEFIETDWQEETGPIYSFHWDGSTILAAGYDRRIYTSNDNGESWVSNDVEVNDYTDFARIGDSYFINSNSTIYRSDDFGLTWYDIYANGFNEQIHTLIGSNGTLIAGGFTNGILVSKDFGQHFEVSNGGIVSSRVRTVYKDKEKLFTGVDYNGISVYNFQMSVWDIIPKLETDDFTNDFVLYKDHLFAASGNTIYKSNDAGNNWSMIDTPPGNPYSLKFYQYENAGESYLLFGGNSSLYIANEDGTSWEPFLNSSHDHLGRSARALVQNGHTLIAITYDSIFRSTDNGLNWHAAMNGFTLDNQMGDGLIDLFEIGGTFFALEDAGYFFMLTTNLYASYDNGETWQLVENGLPTGENKGVRSLTNYNDILIANMVQTNDQVYVSFDNGFSWESFNEGLLFRSVMKIFADNDYMYAATLGNGVYKRKISDLHTLSTIYNPWKYANQIVYPNPNAGEFILEMPDGKELRKIELFDISGKSISVEAFQKQSSIQIRAHFAQPGLYLGIITTDKGAYTFKTFIH